LDLHMPHIDGIMVCREVRLRSMVPIVILSAQGEEARKVQALDLGADDYLTKPFSVAELRARVQAVLRRSLPGNGVVTAPLRCGNLVVDLAARRVRVGEQEVRLTRTEYAILSELARHADKVLTHDMLLSRVWGAEYRGSTHYLHIYVGRLREKLAALQGAEIVTEAGIGYWLRLS
ncbi:MAG: response regulator transcription factor, partial [Ardenticatenaceae bacterium]